MVGKGFAYQDLLQDVLDATLEKKEECKKKRWKVTIKGKQVILRDVLEKMAVWVNKFIAVGDALVQYDPVHAALPWAAIRFMLRVTINNVEIFGALLQAVESVSNSLARCAIMETLYLRSDLQVTDYLRNGLVELYASILTFLAKGLKYFNQNTTVRIAKSIVVSVNDVHSWSSPVMEKQTEVDRLVAIAEAEKSQGLADNVTVLRTGQISQRQVLDKTYLALKQLWTDLKSPISRINKHISSFQDNLERQTRVAIIKSISSINFASQHKIANAGLLPDSGKWFLKKQQFQDWLNESASSVLWLHGIPGSGKTKLTSMVINEIKSTSHLAYFYCVRNPVEPERAECDPILTSLVRQLACPSLNIPILAPVSSRYEDALNELEDFEDVTWIREDCTKALIDLCNCYPAVIFVLDALDEVNPMNRLDLLDALLRVMEESEALVKIFISSRENMDIVARLEEKPNLRISAKENTEDIAKFVHQQLKAANLLNGRLPSSLKEKIPETLIEGAQGMFRWADLQIQSLRPLKVAADIERRLGRLPKSLDDSYFEIFEQIEESGEYALRLAVMTFQWLLYAREPIDLNDFALLASPHSNAAYTTYEVLSVCANLVTSNDQGIFRFTHLSVREFLEGLSGRELHGRCITYFRQEEGNAAIASACLSYLTATVPSMSDKMKDHLSVSKQRETRPALKEYSANYWPYHVSQSGHFKSKAPLVHEVRSFLIQDSDVAPTFTHWCTVVDDMGHRALPDIKEAAMIPPDPIWLAHSYDIIEVRHVSIADEKRQARAFLYAAGKGNCKVMIALLDQGLNIKDIGIEAMEAAVSANRGEAVSLLLDHHVPVDPAWLIEAVVHQHTNVVVPLIQKGSKNFTAKDLSRALTTATANGDFDSVAAFLEQDVQKQPVAVVRALRAETPTAAKHLINTGFDVSSEHLLEERTPLHWAADRGYKNITQILLSRSVPINNGDAYGNTPLHLAAWKGRPAIASMLLEHGAESTRNLSGQTPLHLAVMMGHTKVVKLLFDKGEDVEVEDNDGQTPLSLAQKYNRKDVLAIFGPDNPTQDLALPGPVNAAREEAERKQREYESARLAWEQQEREVHEQQERRNREEAEECKRELERREKEAGESDSWKSAAVAGVAGAPEFLDHSGDTARKTIDHLPPWSIPTLSLIMPTPPGSRTPSVAGGVDLPPPPRIQPQNVKEEEKGEA